MSASSSVCKLVTFMLKAWKSSHIIFCLIYSIAFKFPFKFLYIKSEPPHTQVDAIALVECNSFIKLLGEFFFLWAFIKLPISTHMEIMCDPSFILDGMLVQSICLMSHLMTKEVLVHFMPVGMEKCAIGYSSSLDHCQKHL